MKDTAFLIDPNNQKITQVDLVDGAVLAMPTQNSKITFSELENLGRMFLRPLEGKAPNKSTKEYLNKMATRPAQENLAWLIDFLGYRFIPLAQEEEIEEEIEED